jgi:antitoxin (DNA-binding transcriptional repressor) of toxin-antitoxin stability system
VAKTVGVKEAHRSFSKLLRAAAAGEDIVICVHGRPLACLVRPGVAPPAVGAAVDVDDFELWTDLRNIERKVFGRR